MPFDHYSDQELLVLIKEGNTFAFDELFNRHWETLYLKSFSLLRDPATSEDIVQDVFLKIWQNRDTIQINHFNSYLQTSARNGAFKILAKQKLETRHLNTISTLELLYHAEDEMDAKELESQVLDSLEHLPERCREIFILSRFNNMSNSEIAKKLMLSNRTVENQLYRAIKHLREVLPYLLCWHISNGWY
ncbi:RNA polymerase sigma-70 factor [Echinicola strongylocentroti]|uniref:RNA polymerase sigma-70 factor n=1 Tax=Echinicola strongylocentroti TaxID=1795355 RepID=A0A2Z4IQP7_9BACT|nr:RNA polymerase sigma-70 factor [Echinicola strongylocentroti]AWW32886.1 RNA polymerase sigma-70 factor [Echinicola strongylocentroti]